MANGLKRKPLDLKKLVARYIEHRNSDRPIGRECPGAVGQRLHRGYG